LPFGQLPFDTLLIGQLPFGHLPFDHLLFVQSSVRKNIRHSQKQANALAYFVEEEEKSFITSAPHRREVDRRQFRRRCRRRSIDFVGHRRRRLPATFDPPAKRRDDESSQFAGKQQNQIKKKISCTILSCQTADRFQTSQTGGQQFSDTFHFSIPCFNPSLEPTLVEPLTLLTFKDRFLSLPSPTNIRLGWK